MTTEPLHIRYVVTGATGFIGSALTRRLRATGARVLALSRSRSNTPADDVATVDLASGPLDQALLTGADVVYHLAAKTHDVADAQGFEDEYKRINVDGTRHLVEAARRAGVRRIVFASSVKAVDEGGPEQRDEARIPAPTTAYGRSKLGAERLVFDAAAAGAFRAVCLRFPLVYGAGQRGNLTRMIAAIDRGRFPPPPENGNRRSMLHVENAIDALVLAGARNEAAGQTYLVADAEPYSTREVYDWIREALGKTAIHWSVPVWLFRGLAMGGDLARTVIGRRIGFDSEAFDKLLGSAWYNPQRIMRELGYRPTRNLRASMPELVAAYRERGPSQV